MTKKLTFLYALVLLALGVSGFGCATEGGSAVTGSDLQVGMEEAEGGLTELNEEIEALIEEYAELAEACEESGDKTSESCVAFEALVADVQEQADACFTELDQIADEFNTLIESIPPCTEVEDSEATCDAESSEEVQDLLATAQSAGNYLPGTAKHCSQWNCYRS